MTWHPVRVVRKWVLLRVVVNVASLANEGHESVRALERYSVDWQVVGIGLGREVESGVRLSHGGDSTFAEEVKGFLEGVGINGREVEGKRLEEEWLKSRKVGDARF